MKKSLMKKLPFDRDARKPAKTSETGWPLADMRKEMDRMFTRFFDESPFAALDDWFGDFSPPRFAPTIDVANEKKHVRVTAELPGLNAEDVKLTVEDNALTIRGEKKEEHTDDNEGYYRTERSYGAFTRTVPMPVPIDPDHVEARFDKGVLTVRLPKVKEEKKERSVPISVS